MATEEHWAWIHRMAQPILCADSCGIMAVRETGEIVAASVFDSFTASSANIHMMVDYPMVLRHGWLEAVAHEVFIKRNRKRIFGLTPTNNAKAIKFNKHIGMKKIAEIEDAFDDGIGYVVTRMDRETSPWLAQLREAA